METRFTVLLIELAVAIIIQIGLLIAILMSVRRGSQRMESLIAQVERRAIPALDSAKTMLETSQPLVQDILTNASASSATLRQQLERLDLTLNDVIDRTRLQVIRADELATRAMDKVEEAAESVTHSVTTPARHVAGIVQGIATGMGAFFGRRARDRGSMQRDEMFI